MCDEALGLFTFVRFAKGIHEKMKKKNHLACFFFSQRIEALLWFYFFFFFLLPPSCPNLTPTNDLGNAAVTRRPTGRRTPFAKNSLFLFLSFFFRHHPMCSFLFFIFFILWSPPLCTTLHPYQHVHLPLFLQVSANKQKNFGTHEGPNPLPFVTSMAVHE